MRFSFFPAIFSHVFGLKRGARSFDQIGPDSPWLVHPVAVEVRRLRNRLVWILFAGQVLSTAALIVALGIAAAGVDFLLQVNDRLLRLVLAGSWWAGVSLLMYTRLVPLLLTRVGEVSLSRLMEQYFPQLQGQLAAAVDFALQRESVAATGSRELRQAVMATAWEALRKAECDRAVRRDALWQGAIVLVTALTVVGLFALAAPAAVATGAKRLLLPWVDVSWPQRFHLVVLRPVQEVARGSDFEVEIVDRDGKRLPSGGKAWFQWVAPDGKTVTEVVPLVFVESRTAQRRLGRGDDPRLANGMWIARREKVDRPFFFRVEAGDDRSMPWFFVNITLAPGLRSLEAQIMPPEYTGWKPWRSRPPLAALEGSRINLVAEATKPLRSASVHIGNIGTFPASVDEGNQLTAEFIAQQTTSFWIELLDIAGLKGGEEDRWQLRVFADNPPVVAWAVPRALVPLSSAGRLALAGEAGDDLGLRRIELSFRKGDETVVTLPVYEGPPFPPSPDEEFFTRGPTAFKQPFTVNEPVSSLPVQRGERLTVVAIAEDHRGQRGESPPLVLEVLSTEELLAQILAQEQGLLSELQRALEVEVSAQKLTQQAAKSLGGDRSLVSATAPIVEGALWTQREVRRILVGSSEGVLARVEGLLRIVQENALEGSAVSGRLGHLFRQLKSLEAGPLQDSEFRLLAAIRHLGWLTKEGSSAQLITQRMHDCKQDLGQAEALQQQVIDQLVEMIAAISAQDKLRRLQQELGELIRHQLEIFHRTQNQARNTAGKSLESLSPAERSELQSIAQHQRSLAEQFGRFATGLREWADQLLKRGEAEAKAAEAAAAKTVEVESRGIFSQAVKDIAENRLGQALAQQHQVLRDLKELSELLSMPQHRQDLSAPGAGANFLQAVEDLWQKQREIREEFAAAAALEEKFRRQELWQTADLQDSLREKVTQLRDSLQAETQAVWEDLLNQAEQSMAEAAAHARRDEPSGALAQAELAEKLLNQLRQQANSGQTDPVLAAAAELLGQIVQKLIQVEKAQHALAEQTVSVHDRLARLGNLGRNEKRLLLQLAEEQGAVAGEIASLLVPPEAALLRITLRDVHKAMATAEQNLRRWDTGPATQEEQRRAIVLLRSVLASLVPSEETTTQAAAESSSPSASQVARTPSDQESPEGNPYFLVELRLIRNLQAAVHAETVALVERFGPAENWPESVQLQAENLRQQQERMAELFLELLKSAAFPTLQFPPEIEEAPNGVLK